MRLNSANVNQSTGKNSPPYDWRAPDGAYSPPLEECVPDGAYSPPLEECVPDGMYSPPLEECVPDGMYSPPLEECVPDGAYSPPLEECVPDGMYSLPREECVPDGMYSPPLEECVPDGMYSPPLEGCPQGGVVYKDTITTINNIPIRRNFVENLPFNPSLSKLVRGKRKAGILSEVLFWQQVHKGCFHKIDFDRQRIIGNFIVDFYVKKLGLVIEIDGSSHDYKQDYDTKRQRYLEELGLRVYRITDFDVKNNPDLILVELECYIVREFGIVK